MTKDLDRSWDVIVVGAGLGGLVSAARLAKAGLRVLVLEQHTVAGGYAHHFLRKARGTRTVYEFDVALHQTGDLLPGHATHRMLSDLDVLRRLTLHRFDVAYRTCGPRHDLQVPADADAYEKLLCELEPGQAARIRDLFASLRAIGSLPSAGGLSPEAFAAMGLSLRELFEQHGVDERIQAIVATLWGYLGLVPRHASAFVYARIWASYHLGGCFYFRGGGQALTDALVAVIEEHRGRVVLGAPVLSIRTEAGHIVGVETKRAGVFHAPCVISNASAPATYATLLDDSSLAAQERTKAETMPAWVSIHQAYLGIRGDAAQLGLADRTRFVIPTYDFDVEEKALAENDPRSQGYLLGNHDLADPGHAPAGRSILHAAVMADGRHWMNLDESTYQERKRELESLLIDRIAESIPDVRERIEVVETGTPRTMQRYSWNPNGAIYGPDNSTSAHSIHRPAPRSPVPGLYLAGAWTFPGGGFGGAMSSGWHTASLVMQDVEGGPAK